MKKVFLYLFSFVLGASTWQSCPNIGDEHTYGCDQYTIDWNAVVDSATSSLIKHFWDQKAHYFVYHADRFELGHGNNCRPQVHAMDAIIDAYLRTKDAKCSLSSDQWFGGIKAANFSSLGHNYLNDFYDDSEWIALIMLRLHEATKDTKYFDVTREPWTWIKDGWNELGEGGIAWERKKNQHSKNAYSNGPAAILAARLYQAARDENDLNWAKKTCEWEKQTFSNRATGAVYNSLNIKTGELNTMILNYNQGTFVGAVYELYKLIGDDICLNDIRKAAYYYISSALTIDTGNNILRNEGEGDDGLFKGVFMRYFTQSVLELNSNAVYAKEFTTFLDNNAEVLWREDVNKKVILFGPNWVSTPIGTTQFTLQISRATLMEVRVYYEKNKK